MPPEPDRYIGRTGTADPDRMRRSYLDDAEQWECTCQECQKRFIGHSDRKICKACKACKGESKPC